MNEAIGAGLVVLVFMAGVYFGAQLGPQCPPMPKPYGCTNLYEVKLARVTDLWASHEAANEQWKLAIEYMRDPT